MAISIELDNVTISRLRAELQAAWTASMNDPAQRNELERILGREDLPDEAPFEVTPAEDQFGVLELIFIAVAARLIGAVPDRLLGKVVDEILWPKLEAKFGEGIKRPKDDQADGG